MLSYSRNVYSKDFLVYSHDPGELLVVLVIHCCVNKTEMTRLVEEDGREVDASVGCKAKSKSRAVIL